MAPGAAPGGAPLAQYSNQPDTDAPCRYNESSSQRLTWEAQSCTLQLSELRSNSSDKPVAALVQGALLNLWCGSFDAVIA